MRETVEILLSVLGAYLGVGVVFAPVFVWRGIGRVDPVAAHAGAGFRLIVIPGVVALWPVMAWRWSRTGRSA